jgi:hypothetical protein
MNFTRAVLLIPAVLLSAPTGYTQTSPAPARQDVAPAQETPTGAAAEENRERPFSPTVAANLARAMPKYNPPAPPKPKVEEETEAEQPRNQIIRLPKVVVEGQRPPVFTEREIHTKEGLEALAVARYLTEFDRGVLNRYRLPFVGMTAEQRAMMMYEEEERLRNIEKAKQSIYVLKQVDPEAADQLKKESDAAYIRKSEFLPTSGVR